MEVEGGTVQGAPDGKLAVNGRYSTLKALGSAAAFVISDTPGAGEFTALRPSIVIAQPGRDYFNAVEAMGWRTGLLDYTDPGSVPFYDVLSRADLATDDYGWVEANSVMWGRLYAQANTWPASVDLNLEPADDAVKAKAVADASEILGRSWVQVELTPGGSTQRTWKAVVDGVEHMIDAERWTCRLLFSSGDRWATFTPYSEIGKVANSVTAIVGTHKVGP